MTERSIQNALYWRYRGGASLVIPNYTPRGWFECDLLVITKTGYAHELEIKLTLSDFRADADKSLGQTKHQRLAAGYNFGPSRFSFVMPEGMVELVAVPSWAGLIYVQPWPGRPHDVALKIVRMAPLLHRLKVREVAVRNILTGLYYRFWSQRVGQFPPEATP